MITINDFLLNLKPFGEYTVKEVKKLCKKNKSINLEANFYLGDFEPEELNALYKQVCSYFEKEFNYTGQIRIFQGVF